MLEWNVYREVDETIWFREAYAEKLEPGEMDTARVGQPAPDFSARTIDGKSFRLSSTGR